MLAVVFPQRCHVFPQRFSLRILGISSCAVSQYIDDRHVGKSFRSPARASLVASKVLAEAAAYIMCYLVIEAGYFIGIAKSQWVAFLLPDDKKLKFSSFREQMLASRNIGLNIPQEFSGKVVSIILAVPG